MRVKILSASVVAAALAVGVHAQAQQQPPTQQQPPSSQMDKAITVIGCVAKQADVLEGAMSTPANPAMGDEFVLTHASLKSSGSAPAASEASAPAGMQDDFGKVYRATGDKEESLKTYVGQRVQVTGSFKDPEDATRELRATGTSGFEHRSEAVRQQHPRVHDPVGHADERIVHAREVDSVRQQDGDALPETRTPDRCGRASVCTADLRVRGQPGGGGPPYSVLSAATGAMRVARRAGPAVAATAIRASAATESASVVGSAGAIP